MNLGEIILDAENSKASRAGRTIDLTPDELHLLETACGYPNWQPTALELAQAVSRPESPCDEVKLSQLLLALRNKLDPACDTIFPALFSSTQTATFTRQVDPYVGSVLADRYVLTKLIGGGSSSLVYQGRRRHDNKPVAVKLLIVNSRSSPEVLARFKREARLNSVLVHKNIVAVEDYGVGERDQPFLVMELLDGATLQEIVEKHGLPNLVEVLGFFRQVCDGLSYAHSQGIVHRDIKPNNMMVMGSGESGFTVKIVDFGLARLAENDNPNTEVTQAGNVVGSPPYMSPEQCRGEQVDHRSDIYSLGCSLYEMLHGDLPYLGKDPVSVMIKHLKAPIPEMEVKRADSEVNAELNKVVSRCLAKEREARYQTASEVASELARCEALLSKEKPGTWEPKNKVLSWLAARFR